MPSPAHVSSVPALDSFRSDLIIYISKVKPALFEIMDEIGRTKSWLSTDQRLRWENEIRKQSRRLEELQAELFDAKISQLKRPTALQQMAVQKARASLDDALAHKAAVQRWIKELDLIADPLLKHVEQLQSFLTTDIAHAASYLSEVVRTLENYAALRPTLPDLASARASEDGAADSSASKSASPENSTTS